MVLVMGITLPAGIEIVYNKQIRMYDISVMCNVGKNPRFFPRSKFYTLREITYLYEIAYAWSLMTADQKAEWNFASNVIGEHGYNLYVQDKSYRKKHGLAGDATPSLYHQYLVGHLGVSAPASRALVVQYYKRKTVFPCSFELCFKSALEASGADPYCRFVFKWMRYYRGENIENVETINLPLSSGWDKRKKWVQSKLGIKGKFKVEIELNDVVGDLWFDNVIVEFGGEIRLNDPYCFDVPYYWEVLEGGEGVVLETVYPSGEAE